MDLHAIAGRGVIGFCRRKTRGSRRRDEIILSFARGRVDRIGARQFDEAVKLGNPVLDRLEGADRLAERLARYRIVARYFHQRFGAAGLFLLKATEEQLRSQLIQLAVNAAFVLGFWFLLSTTPGKLVINAYIVDAKTLGKPRPWQLVVRYLGYYLSILTLMLGFLWVAFDRRKQGLHDKLAGTVVIRGKPVLNSRQDDA